MNPTHTQKNGAALVIAIGFLAILTIIIIAFSAQVRTERLAGRGFLVAAQNRQLLGTALARAMDDLDLAATGTDFPPFLALASQGTQFLADSLDFTTEEEYIPGSGSPIHSAYTDALNNDAQWEVVADADGISIGRIGYVVLNTSGLLDANSVGGYSNATPLAYNKRGSGVSPGEIQLSPALLDELGSGSLPLLSLDEHTTDAALAFACNRSNAWKRFETLRDVKVLNERGGTDIITKQPESFSTFSLFPNDESEKIPLTPDMDRATFLKTLQASGLDAKQADAVYAGYLDYVDVDSIPNDLASSSTEAVPMINEIWIEDFQFSQDVNDATNVDYRISGDLYVEIWYPFNTPYPNPFVLRLFAADPNENDSTNEVEIVEGESFIGINDYITITAAYSNNVGKSFILELIDYSEENTGLDFRTFHYSFGFDQSVELATPFEGDGSVPYPTPITIYALEENIEVVDANDPVDRVENIQYQWDFGGNDAVYDEYASCIDPRVNFNFADERLWIMSSPASSNAINTIDGHWGEETDLADKSDIRFHVRNGPMENAAELGFLSIGDPWRTVRLYASDGAAHPLNPVLDHFDVGESLWAKSRRPGLVNQNSPHTNVLASAFYDAPIQQNAEQDSDERVTTGQARLMGANLANRSAAMPQRNLSYIGNAVSNNIPDWASLTDAKKESIVANSYRLFGWRDTLFTILLAAQKGTDADNDGLISDDEVQSTQKAVVYVWRDPATGKAACVFYGLSDTLQSSISGGSSWNTLLDAFRP